MLGEDLQNQLHVRHHYKYKGGAAGAGAGCGFGASERTRASGGDSFEEGDS
jgi:hypothetical protein